MPIVYKAVDIYNGLMCSIAVPRDCDYFQWYSIGETVHAKAGGFYCFKTLRDARNYANAVSCSKILRCKAAGKVQTARLGSMLSSASIDLFWNSSTQRPWHWVGECPSGTVLYKTLTPSGIVK